MITNDGATALIDMHQRLSAWYEGSIQYGFDADDSGINEGASYVIAQVLGGLRSIGVATNDPANLIWATAVLMEKLIPERNYTLDIPFGYGELAAPAPNDAPFDVQVPLYDWRALHHRPIFVPRTSTQEAK